MKVKYTIIKYTGKLLELNAELIDANGFRITGYSSFCGMPKQKIPVQFLFNNLKVAYGLEPKTYSECSFAVAHSIGSTWRYLIKVP